MQANFLDADIMGEFVGEVKMKTLVCLQKQVCPVRVTGHACLHSGH